MSFALFDGTTISDFVEFYKIPEFSNLREIPYIILIINNNQLLHDYDPNVNYNDTYTSVGKYCVRRYDIDNLINLHSKYDIDDKILTRTSDNMHKEDLSHILNTTI